MQLRWKRFWIGMDLLVGAWIVALFWLAFHGYSHWWWPGLGLCFLYALVRYSVLAVDHVRAWRLWALFDFAVWAIVGAMAFASEGGNPWAVWGLGLLLAHYAFVRWRARRWPRHP